MDQTLGSRPVYSEPGNGTKFTFYLPANDESADTTLIPDAPSLPKGDGKCILLIDDENSILQVAKTTLEIHGYVVQTASSGAAGIALFQKQSSAIRVVIVDMMMPELDGSDTIRVLRSIRPDIPVIASSGLKKPEHGKGSIESTAAFLSKPYSDEQLLKAIQLVLEQKGS